MNLPQKPKRILETVSLLLCLGLAAGHILAGAIQRTPLGQTLHWKLNTPIPYAVNTGGVPGFTGELQRLVVLGAVNDSFRPWSQIPDAAVVFSGGGSSNVTLGCADGLNLVTFQDNQSVSFPPGVLAIARVISAPFPGLIASGTSAACPQSRQYNAEFAGQILEADILFNPNPGSSPFSPVGANNSIDLIAVATHEVGHLLGLDHTGVFSSIMNPYSESGAGIASRSVQTDDTNTIASLYPAATFAPSRGSILGTITDSAGAPVKSANVVAFSTTGGVPVGSQLSGSDGRYSIDGLLPGNYHVFVEPLDGPISLFNFPGFYSTGSNNFATTFLPATGTFTTLSVAAGGSATANIVVSARSASTLNIDELGISTTTATGTSFLFGTSPLFLPRGRSYDIFVTGQNLPGDANLTAFGNGITGSATTAATLPNSQPIRKQTLTITPTAAIGPSNLHLANSGSISVIPGGIITTVNPVVGLPLRDTAGFGSLISPGALIAIFGSDLGFGNGPGNLESAVAKPLPTNLGGVSVKIGNRFAPLIFVAPGQIAAQVPFELTGSTTDLTIVAGPNASGNTVTVPLSPTSPGIFSVNQQGTGQGIVLHNPDPAGSIVAPAGSIPGRPSRPIRPGEFMTIYAVGLGPVTPSIPSGLAPIDAGDPLRRLVSPITVRIGGQALQAANIPYAGLNPNFVALYQVDVQIPANVQTGDAVSLQMVTSAGQASNTVTIAISP